MPTPRTTTATVLSKRWRDGLAFVVVGERPSSRIPALSKNGKIALADHPLLTPRSAAPAKGHEEHHLVTTSPQLSRNFSQDHGE